MWVEIAVHVIRALVDQKKSDDEKPGLWRAPRPAPWPAAPSERVLVVGMHREATEGARDLRLRTSGGEAWLVLCDPPDDASVTEHDAVLEVRNRQKGAAFLAAIARWAAVPPPPPPAKPGELRPFALRWSRVARTGDLETIALRLAWRDLAATVNVQIRPGASACRLVEADPSQRRALVAILTVALRDGAPA